MALNADTLIGQVVGGYQLDRVLGRGGAGIVYLGHVPDHPLHRVAIKILIPPGQMTAQEQAEFRKRFLREADTLTRLRHPHILAIQFAAEDKPSGLVYMIMDYLAGGTLEDLLRRGPLSFPQVSAYVTQLAGALDYAHSFNVIHRDLKPANVLLDERGNAYLADFGIAKLLDASATTMTKVNQVIGTPSYMAPEQITNERISPATDVYGLGNLTYQMVTGRAPFDSPSLLSLMRQITTDEPPPPREFRPDLPVSAANVLLHALAKRPAERFASAGEFALAWDSGLQGGYMAPSPQTLSTQPAFAAFAFAQPNDALLAPAGTNNQTTNILPTDRRPRRRWLGVIAAALLFTLAIGGIAAVAVLGRQAKGEHLNLGSTQTVPTSTSAPVGTPIGTSTSVPATAQPAQQITSCAQVSGFASAGVANAGKHFTDVTFLANSRSLVTTTAEVKGYQYQVIKVCTPSASVNSVRAFFTTKMISNGWAQSSTLPLNGDPTSACASGYCWVETTTPAAPPRYVSVEMQSGEGNFGSVAVYQLRVFVAPLAGGNATIVPGGKLIFDQTGLGEYAWDSGTNQINLTNGAMQVSFGTTDFDSITLGILETTSYGGGFIDPTRTDLGNGIEGVKSGNGHYIKWQILSYNSSQMQVRYVTYAYSIT
jgi:serine/threonine protein kinase